MSFYFLYFPCNKQTREKHVKNEEHVACALFGYKSRENKNPAGKYGSDEGTNKQIICTRRRCAGD